MTRLLPLLALLPTLALANTPATPDPVELAQIAGAIVVKINGAPVEIIFVSKKGQVAALKFQDCVKNADCYALGSALSKLGKIDELDLTSGTGI